MGNRRRKPDHEEPTIGRRVQTRQPTKNHQPIAKGIDHARHLDHHWRNHLGDNSSIFCGADHQHREDGTSNTSPRAACGQPNEHAHLRHPDSDGYAVHDLDTQTPNATTNGDQDTTNANVGPDLVLRRAIRQLQRAVLRRNQGRTTSRGTIHVNARLTHALGNNRHRRRKLPIAICRREQTTQRTDRTRLSS